MSIMDFINEKQGFFDKVMNKIEIKKQIWMNQVAMKIEELHKRLIRNVISAFLYLAAIVILLISAIYAFIQHVGLSKSLSFLIVGGLLLILGFLIMPRRKNVV